MNTKSEIRKAVSSDLASISTVHQLAFKTNSEAELVQLIHSRDKVSVSLVAILQGKVVGHILFSPVSMGGVGLAPVAVRPEFQGCGIGSDLIKYGIAILRSEGYPFLVVLGSPDFYSRFDFKPAYEFSLQNEYGVRDEFMILELAKNGLPLGPETIRYLEEFNEVGV